MKFLRNLPPAVKKVLQRLAALLAAVVMLILKW